MWELKLMALMAVLMRVSGNASDFQRVQTEVVRFNLTCPERAVCADIFDYNQFDEEAGVMVPKTRRVINCRCGNSDCPNTTRHTLHASPRHRQQICTPRNRLSRCKGQQISEQMIVNSDDFNGKTYHRLNCRCRRHRNPRPNRNPVLFGGFRARVTELLGQSYESDHWVHNYICVRRRPRRTRA